MSRFLITVVVLTSFAGVASCWRPGLSRYEHYFTAGEKLPPIEGQQLRATYFGSSTLYFTDGDTHLMIDGFFTRSEALQETFLAKIAPSHGRIKTALSKSGISRLDAIFVAHSHYDHALDSADVARITKADLWGSDSTWMIAKGVGFPESRYNLVEPGKAMEYGRFKVTMLKTRHGPFTVFGGAQRGTPDDNSGAIAEPIEPPAMIKVYLEGQSYAFYIEHPLGNIVVQPSAGYVEGQFDGCRADVVFAAMARLGSQTMPYRERYFREVIKAPGARLVIPIHWDNYTQPLDQPLEPMHNLMDDFHDGMRFMTKAVAETPGLEMQMLQAFDEVVLYRGER